MSMTEQPTYVQHDDVDVAELLTVANAVVENELSYPLALLWARRILGPTATTGDVLGDLTYALEQASAYDTYGADHVRAVHGSWDSTADEAANGFRDQYRADARLSAELAVSVSRARAARPLQAVTS